MANLHNTQKAGLSSIVSLLNPFSSVAQTYDYVPQGVIDLGRKLLKGDNNKYKDRITHLVFKTGVNALTAAALVTAIRSAKHITDMQQISGKSLHKSLAKRIKTTTDPLVQGDQSLAKNASFVSNTRLLDSNTQSLSTWLPAVATLLAAAGAYTLVDKAQDRILNRQLTSQIKDKTKQLSKYIIARAAQARDNHNSPQYKQVVQQNKLSKTAAFFGLNDALTLFVAALGLGSAAAVYSWAAGRDKNRLEYKAAKKALKEYGKQRAISQSLVSPALSAQTIKYIQGSDRRKDAPVVELPQGITGPVTSVEI